MSQQHGVPVSKPNENEIGSEVSTLDRRGVLAGILGGTAALGGAALAGASSASAAPAPPVEGPFVAKSVMPVNVKDHGATGDGETDDSDAIQAAITAAEESGASVFFPAGTYVVSSPWRADGPVVLRGEGMWFTTIAVTQHAGFVDLDTHARLLVVEDMAFDNLGNEQAALDIEGGFVHEFVFRRCRFVNMGGGNGAIAAVEIFNAGTGEFADCLWHNPAVYAGHGTGVRVQGSPGAAGGRGDIASGGKRVRFVGNNRMLWVNNGIRIQGIFSQFNQQANFAPCALQYLEIDGAYFDGFWWAIPASHSGEGEGVTYTAGELSDPSADFSDVDANRRPNIAIIRAMPLRHAGQVGTATGTILVEDGADFIAAGVRRMDIVRSSGRWAVVAVEPFSEEHPDTVQVEEWLDDETLLPATPPESGADYTIHSIIYGEGIGVSEDSHTLLLDPDDRTWRDLYGNEVVPEDGTRYEVAQIRPTVHLSVSPGGLLNLRLVNSTFRRGWADMASLRAQSSQCVGNLFEDGQELGLVLQGGWDKGHLVANNVVRHVGGAGPLNLACSHAVAIGNYLEGNGWKLDREHAGDIWVIFGRRNHVAHNISVAGPETQSRRAAVTIQQQLNPIPSLGTNLVSEDNIIEHNYRYGHDEDEPDVTLQGAGTIENNKIIGARRMAFVGGAETAQLVETTAAGSPEGVYVAAPGSTYRRTDGGPGETLYVKESGDGDTGWVAK